jgi:hypothetical protein
MADLFAPHLQGVLDGTLPPNQQSPDQKSKVRSFLARINLATLAITTADNVLLGVLPQGAVPLYGVILASVTMGASATLAIGTNKVHASNGQYRAAAVFTAADTPTLFGLAANMGVVASNSAETPVYLTNGVANLPGAGTLIIEVFYASPS